MNDMSKSFKDISLTKSSKSVNILSIDGGGVKGVLSAEILYYIERKLQTLTNSNIKLAEHFDLIVGTSTGAILTGIYTMPDDSNYKTKYEAIDAIELYESHAKEIFRRNFWQKIRSGFSIFGAKYKGEKLHNFINRYFKNTKVLDTTTNTMFTSIDIKNRELFLFKSYNSKKSHKLSDAVISSASAPTYFPPYEISHKEENVCLIDGGIGINNPSMSAYVEAKRLFPNADNINLLSIGTGKFEEKFKYIKVKKWGKLKWIRPLIDILLGSMSEVADYQSDVLYQTVYKGKYLRINPVLKYGSHIIDKTTKRNINNLKRDGREITTKMANEIKSFLKHSLK